MYRILLLLTFCISVFVNAVFAQTALDLSLHQAGEAYRKGDFASALVYAEQVLEMDSLSLEAHVLRGSSHLALKQPVLAGHAADEGIHHFPEAPVLKWIRAEALLQQNQMKQALPLYEELYAKQGNNTRPKRGEVSKRLGMIHQVMGNTAFGSKDFKEAEEHFVKVRKYMPDSLHSYHNLALVYLQQKQWKNVLKVTTAGLSKFPGNSSLLRMRANAHYRTKDFEGVVEQYRMLYEQQPADLETALQYARLLMTSGKTEEAYAIYDRLLKEQPDNREVYESLAKIYKQRDDQRMLRSLLRKMQERFPEDDSITERIAHTYEEEEQWHKARQIYDSLREKKKDPSVDLAVARTWEQQDSLQAALEVYSSAVEKYAENAELLWRKGEAEERLKLYEEAKKTYQKLLYGEDNSDHYIRLGRVYEALNQPDEALLHYSKAIGAGTNEPFPYYHSARILREKGSREQAFELVKKALIFALDQVTKQQQLLASRLQKQNNLLSVKDAGLQGKALKKYNRMAEDIFFYLRDHFTGKKVLPLLRKLETDYPESSRLLYLLSTYYEQTENGEKQFLLLQRSVELNPQMTEAHLALGNYHSEQGKSKQAIGAYERAVSTGPEHPDAYGALIQLYRENGRLNSLIERWKARYRVRPELEVLRDHLIEALHKAGRYEEAGQISQN